MMTKTKPFFNIDLKGDWDNINQSDIEKIDVLNISLNELKAIMRNSNSPKMEFYFCSVKYPFENLKRDLFFLSKNLSAAKIIIISVTINNDVNLADIKNICEIFSDITDDDAQVKISIYNNKKLNSEVILDILKFN